MKMILKITLPGKGVPGPVLDLIDKALHTYYDETPFGRAWAPGPVWGIDIGLVPENPEDEVEADRIAGRVEHP